MTPLPTLSLDANSVRLSDPVKATLTIEGPAPLVVTLPKDLLIGEAATAWRIRPLGPATVAPLLDGHERWTITCRLDPYLPGEAVPVVFAPFAVSTGGTTHVVSFPTQSVKVQATVTVETAVRGVTGIEVSPPLPATEERWPLWPILAVAVFAGSVLVMLMRRRKPIPMSPAVWAEQQLADLNPQSPAFAERLANVLRIFIERQTAVPAPRLTTVELMSHNLAMPLVPILQQCDAAKFADKQLSSEDRIALLADARKLVESHSQPG